jgi:hypothetical protein
LLSFLQNDRTLRTLAMMMRLLALTALLCISNAAKIEDDYYDQLGVSRDATDPQVSLILTL